jgi:signal transduction histidine kinase
MYGTGLVAAAISQPVWEVRGAWTAALAPLILFGVFRHQRWVRDIQPSQNIVFHATLTLLGACCFAILIAIVNIIDGFIISFADHVSVFVLAFGSLGLGLTFSSERFRTSLAIWVAKNCFKFRYDYRLEWEQLTKVLDQQGNETSLQQSMCKALAHLTHSPGGCLYLLKGNQYEKCATWGENTNQFSNNISPALLAQHQSHLGPFLFVDSVFWCGVPLYMQKDCIGIIILAKPHIEIDFNWEVKDFLSLAGKQIATHLHQAGQAKALTVAKQFEAIHKVSTFVAHDLTNIASIVATIQSNAKIHGDNPEFVQSVYRSLDGIHQRVQSLLTRIEQPEQQKQLFAWSSVIKHIQASFRHSKPELMIRGTQEQWQRIQLNGDAEQFTNILSHLIKNAQQATLNYHAVYLDIEYDNPQLIIRIIDQGCGMSADFIQNSFFEPFVSTKGTMGIGVYQAKQVVESMGGEIAVQSKQNQGTQLTLKLPVIYSRSLAREQEIL